MKRQMVIGWKTMPSLEQMPLNVPGSNKTVGLWRYGEDGVTTEDYYDYATQTIGPYKFREAYTYVDVYYSDLPTPDIDHLYEALFMNKNALAAIFVNNTFVCLVYPDCLVYSGIKEAYYDYRDIHLEGVRNIVNIGWIKTHLQSWGAPNRPFQLQMDTSTFEVFMGYGHWMKLPSIPVMQMPRFGAYTRLLEHPDASAVYVDFETNEEVYLKEE